MIGPAAFINGFNEVTVDSVYVNAFAQVQPAALISQCDQVV
jgi:hypothetical protein